jgi:hypothetical protein
MTEETKKWDYRVQQFGSTWSTVKPDNMEATLIEWGVEGWEVISAVHKSTNEVIVIAKRPLTREVIRARSMPSY